MTPPDDFSFCAQKDAPAGFDFANHTGVNNLHI
jgi:hypothetical protein